MTKTELAALARKLWLANPRLSKRQAEAEARKQLAEKVAA